MAGGYALGYRHPAMPHTGPRAVQPATSVREASDDLDGLAVDETDRLLRFAHACLPLGPIGPQGASNNRNTRAGNNDFVTN